MLAATEERLDQQRNEYLRQRDWTLLSGDEDVSDSVWLWCKILPDGRHLLLVQEQAIMLEQELWPEAEDEGQAAPEPVADAPPPPFELLPDMHGENWQQITSKMFQLLREADDLFSHYGLLAQPNYGNCGRWICDVRDMIGTLEATQAAAAALPA